MTMRIIPDTKFNFSTESQADTPAQGGEGAGEGAAGEATGATEDLTGATEADKGGAGEADKDKDKDKGEADKDKGGDGKGDDKDKDKDKGKGEEDDKGKKPESDDTAANDGDDDDDADTDEDDDAAEEAISELSVLAAAFSAQDAAVEAMGGLQPSMIMMTASMAGIDLKSDPSLMAVESLGSDTPEASVALAMEAIEEQAKGAIGRALDSMGTFVGSAINRVDDLIRKVPGGSAASDLEKKVENAFSGVTAGNAMKVLTAATVAIATVAAIGGVIALRRAGAGATPKMAETIKRVTETAIKRATTGFGSAGGSVNTVSRAMGAATKAESGTVGALGWTKAAYGEVVTKLTRVLEDSKKAYDALGKGIKTAIESIKGTGAEGVGIEAVKDMLRALGIVIRFVRAVAVGVIGVGLVRVMNTCRKLADHEGSSAAA